MNAEQNNTVSLPQLIKLLSDITGVDAAGCRKFLHEFFSLIEESLVQGQSVKIKGIGSFAAEDKENGLVRFTPDPELAAAVNTPFAMFEPIEIGDGFPVEDLVEDTDKDSENPQDEPTSNDIILAIDESHAGNGTMEADSEATATADTDAENTETATADADTGNTETVTADADAGNTETVTADADTGNTETVTADADAGNTESSIDEEEANEMECDGTDCGIEANDEAVEPESDIDLEEEPEEESPKKRHGIAGYAFAVLSAMVIGFAGGYFTHSAIGKQDATMPETSADSVAAPSVEEVSLGSVADEGVKAQLSDTIVMSSATAPESVMVFDTISRNHFLASMARHHYGHMEYWVYIYEANPGLGHPDRIKPGTVVTIPTKASFSLRSDSATMANARRLYAEIYSRYK